MSPLQRFRRTLGPPFLSRPAQMADAFADIEVYVRRVGRMTLPAVHRELFTSVFASCLVLDEGEGERVGTLWGAEVWVSSSLSPDTVILVAG